MTRIPADMPAYAYIKRELKTRIEGGDLAEGDRIPSELELARHYNVSRNPTRQALRDLELEGYITRMPGRGSFVAPVQKRQRLFKISGWRAVAVACPEVEGHYTRAVIQGFISRAAEQGIHTMVYFLRLSNESEFDFLADLRNSGIEGIALWLQHPTSRTLELLGRFRRSGYPFVLVDRYVRDLECDFVVTHNEDMTWRLTRALIARGHRRIGMVMAPADNTAVEERLAGYRRALKEAGLPFVREAVGVFPEGESVHAVVNRILALRGRPTAFLCANDGAALKLLDELTELGYRVPEDVELALVDDSELAAALEVPVLAAAQAGHDMGREAAELLLARIEEPDRPVARRFLKAQFLFDESGNGSAGGEDALSVKAMAEAAPSQGKEAREARPQPLSR